MPIRGNKIWFDFDPLIGSKVPTSLKPSARNDIASFVKEQVLSHVGGAKSPVKNGKWKASLSPEYKAIKRAFSSNLKANMELRGGMLDDLEVIVVNDKIRLQIEGKNAKKADGHNNHSGKSKLPSREFIPKKAQSFNTEIESGIRKIVAEFEVTLEDPGLDPLKTQLLVSGVSALFAQKKNIPKTDKPRVETIPIEELFEDFNEQSEI